MSCQLKMMRPPTKLNITTLDRIAYTTASEIDILGVVVWCGPSKYVGRSTKKYREITIADDHFRKNQFMLTLWDDFGEIEGTELQAKIENAEEFPVILGRNIGVSGYQGLSLQTRFSSSIRINPNYPQALELMNWAKTNKFILSSQVSDGFSGLFAPPVMPLAHQQLIFIAEITSETKVEVFYVEAEMVISNDLQQFCVLECPGCKQKNAQKTGNHLTAPSASNG